MTTHELARILLAAEPFEIVGDFCEPANGWENLAEVLTVSGDAAEAG